MTTRESGKSRREILILNMAHHASRLSFLSAQLSRLQLSFTRIEGVNGRQLSPESLARIDVASYARLSRGEIGCFESHRSAWQKIVDEDLEGAFILEDDVILASDFGDIDFSDPALKNADIFKLDTHPLPALCSPEHIAAAPGREFRRLLSAENSASCYYLTNKGARELVTRCPNYYLPADLFMFSPESACFNELEIWKLYPSMAAQLKFLPESEGLEEDMTQGIQVQRNSQVDPRPDNTWWRKLMLRVRLLRERNFRWARERRARKRLAEWNGGVQEAAVFDPVDRTHIDESLEEIGGEKML